MKYNDISNKLVEGKSPHKKGTKKYNDHMAAMHAESNVEEGTEMGNIGDVSVKQFASKDGIAIQLTGSNGYVQLSREEAAQLAARLANWAGSRIMARPGEYESVQSETTAGAIGSSMGGGNGFANGGPGTMA